MGDIVAAPAPMPEKPRPSKDEVASVVAEHCRNHPEGFSNQQLAEYIENSIISDLNALFGEE